MLPEVDLGLFPPYIPSLIYIFSTTKHFITQLNIIYSVSVIDWSPNGLQSFPSVHAFNVNKLVNISNLNNSFITSLANITRDVYIGVPIPQIDTTILPTYLQSILDTNLIKDPCPAIHHFRSCINKAHFNTLHLNTLSHALIYILNSH